MFPFATPAYAHTEHEQLNILIDTGSQALVKLDSLQAVQWIVIGVLLIVIISIIGSRGKS